MAIEDVEVFLPKESFCYGCGCILKQASILVCSECLGDECDKFEKMVEDEQVEENISVNALSGI